MKHFIDIAIKSLFAITFFLHCSNLRAQQTGKVEGHVMHNGRPLEWVTVSLSQQTDPPKTFHTLTDSSGHFTLDKLPWGEYRIQFSLIGYKPSAKKIVITATASVLKMDPLSMEQDNGTLKTVTVTSTKKIIQRTEQGYIVNAGANLTATGGTATDILKNAPNVSVDAEGVITLRGKTPLILLNGRNSNLANPDQIPASSIESIEIINNPTAQYDANAESGIINIKLKKNKQNGTNGALALGAGAGSRGRINSSFLINHKSGKWNVGVGYDNRFAGRTRMIDASRTNVLFAENHLLNQHRNDKRLEQLQNLKLNLDFNPDTRNAFSFEAIGNREGQDNNESLNSALYDQGNNLNSYTNRHSLELERSKVAEFALDYHRKFADEQKTLTVNITSSINRDRENTDITSQSLDKFNMGTGNPWYQRTHNYENGNVSSARLDYAFPAFHKGLFETGYKTIYRKIVADFLSADLIDNTYIPNPASSTVFKFNELVQAAYMQYDSRNGKDARHDWDYDLGLRAEQAINEGQTKNSTTNFTNHYFNLFPTASLTYKRKEEAFWKVSYAKRINRPGLGQLNPFIDITDSLNPHSGNPRLKPEIIHALELGYTKEWAKGSWNSSLFYRYSLNTIRSFVQLQPNGAAWSFPVNVGSASTVGIENIYTGSPSRYYDINASFSLFRQQLNGSNIAADAVRSATGWYVKWINNFVPWPGGRLQFSANYNSALPTPQGQRIAQYFADLGFQQKWGKGNARIGITVTDIFNTFKSGYTNNTPEFYNFRYGKADTRAFIITFAYTFKSAFKEKLLENKFSTDY